MPVNQFKNRVDALLQQGTKDLSMTLGVLARIEHDSYEIVAVQSNSGAFVAGEKFRLGDSFCRDVYEQQTVIAQTCIDNSPISLHHPLYRSLPLECYIGAPVLRQGRSWGCLDFSSMAQRDEAFNANEIELIETMAAECSQWVEKID